MASLAEACVRSSELSSTKCAKLSQQQQQLCPVVFFNDIDKFGPSKRKAEVGSSVLFQHYPFQYIAFQCIDLNC